MATVKIDGVHKDVVAYRTGKRLGLEHVLGAERWPATPRVFFYGRHRRRRELDRPNKTAALAQLEDVPVAELDDAERHEALAVHKCSEHRAVVVREDLVVPKRHSCVRLVYSGHIIRLPAIRGACLVRPKRDGGAKLRVADAIEESAEHWKKGIYFGVKIRLYRMSVFGARPPAGLYFCGPPDIIVSGTQAQELVAALEAMNIRPSKTPDAEADIEVFLENSKNFRNNIDFQHNHIYTTVNVGYSKKFGIDRYLLPKQEAALAVFSSLELFTKELAALTKKNVNIVNVALRTSHAASNQDWHHDNNDATSRVLVIALSHPFKNTQFRPGLAESECSALNDEGGHEGTTMVCGSEVEGSFSYFSNNICHRAPTIQTRGRMTRSVLIVRMDFDECPPRAREVDALNQICFSTKRITRNSTQ